MQLFGWWHYYTFMTSRTSISSLNIITLSQSVAWKVETKTRNMTLLQAKKAAQELVVSDPHARESEAIKPSYSFQMEKNRQKRLIIKRIVWLAKVCQGLPNQLKPFSWSTLPKTLTMKLYRKWFNSMAFVSEILHAYLTLRHAASHSNYGYQLRNLRDYLMRNCGQRVWLFGCSDW